MKAVYCTRYGSPDVLELRDVPKPVPREGEVLIRVNVTTVTIGSVRVRGLIMPMPYRLLTRLILGLRRPRRGILGHEFAGVVESTGGGVTRYQRGDRVFGSTGLRSGANAEYVCLPETATFVPTPDTLADEEAASIPTGALTALYFLRRAGLHAGQHVLVHGASGSVGVAAVQIGRALGARVTGVCSTANLDLVRGLGAEAVFDYTQSSPAGWGSGFDIVFDAVGLGAPGTLKKLLASGGAFASVNQGLLKSRREDLEFLKRLIEEGALRAVIDRRYPLEQIREAHRYVEQGHKKGNVVVTLRT